MEKVYYPADEKSEVNILTGTLIANARANPGKGYEKMHNQPYSDSHFNEPYIKKVDFPNVLFKRAIYDPEKETLIITTEPGNEK